MKPKQLAQELKISDVEVLRLAIQTGITNPSFKTLFSLKQINDIKEQFAKNSTHQLPPVIERQIPETNLEEAESAIEQVSESVPQEVEAETGIAEIRQTALSNAIAADESQSAHILEVELHQAADDGLRRGVVEELVFATKQREGAMLVRDAIYRKKQASRSRLNELLKDSAGDDFLSTSQISSQTYAKTASVGAATMTDTYQALKNLGINL